MVLVPPPRMHLTRFHGVFAPHSPLRAAPEAGVWDRDRASRSRRSSPESSRIWKRPLRTRTRPSCRSAHGHRRRRLACVDSEGEACFRWPMTWLGRVGACGYCAGRQVRVVCAGGSLGGPGIQRQDGRRAGGDWCDPNIRPGRRSGPRGKGWFEFPCPPLMGQVSTVNAAAYTASKHAVVGLTKSIALEYAREGIRDRDRSGRHRDSDDRRTDLRSDSRGRAARRDSDGSLRATRGGRANDCRTML